MKQFLRFGVIPTALFAPMLVLAQFTNGDDGLANFFQAVTVFIQSSLIPIIIAIAFVMFVYGAIRYFLVADSDGGEDSREQGRKLMLWGIIAFVVIVSVWGIVALIANGIFGSDTTLDFVPDPPAER